MTFRANWTFFARCYGWGATGEYRLKIGVFAPTRSVWPKISGKKRVAPPTILLIVKLSFNDLSFGIRMYAQLSFVLSQMTHLTDGQTDSFLVARPRCHAHSAVRSFHPIRLVSAGFFSETCTVWIWIFHPMQTQNSVGCQMFRWTNFNISLNFWCPMHRRR